MTWASLLTPQGQTIQTCKLSLSGVGIKMITENYGLTKPHYNVHIYKSFTHNTGYLTIHLVFDRCINNRQKDKL